MTSSGLQRAIELHEAGVTASNDMRPAAGERNHRAALRALHAESGRDADRVRGRILVSLAYAVAERGDTARGLTYLDEATQLLPLPERGVLHGQRAVLLRRTGRDDEALAEYDLALGVLDERREPRELARVLLNRGVLHLRASRTPAARADLSRASRVAHRNGLSLIATKAQHNLALLDLAAGDLPRALRTFTAVAREYATSAPGILPLLGLDRARVLLAAGLFREADAELATAVAALQAQGMGQDAGEALLARAEAALLGGRTADARHWALQAGRHFGRRKNGRWRALAELTGLRASTRLHPRSVRRLQVLAVHLADLGLDEDARVAGLLAARCAADLGHVGNAQELLRSYARTKHGDRLDTRGLSRLTRAAIADAAGDRAAAGRQLSAGLAELHRYRATFGSLDLQTGAAVYGRDIASAGLRRVLDGGRPTDIFRWSERSRAQALLLPPVRPPDDPETAAALERLRQLRLSVREAERAGRPVASLRTQCGALEDSIRQRMWSLAGQGQVTEPVPMRVVAGALGDTAMIVYLRAGVTLHALVLCAGAAQVVPLGPAAVAEEAVLRLRADLDSRAGRVLPDRLAAAILGSTHRDAQTLSETVLAAILPIIGDRDLVIVPTGGLLTAPWSLLPGCTGRPVTVAASATSWYTARARGPATSGDTGSGSVALVAGPGNDRADIEVGRIAELYPDATVLTGAAATAGATATALDGASLAHVAAHGTHQTENALFSALELADGPLMGYDLYQLDKPPLLAVLSTCDLGLSDVRPGDESIGMSTALIAAGTATVIASVSRVADDVAMRLMTVLHRELANGCSPARALAVAAIDDPTGFVCFGAGT